MAVDVRILSATWMICVVYTHTVYAEDARCGYMLEIPRPITPDLEDLDFTGTTWSERPLWPAETREDLCMDEFHLVSTTSSIQIIYMEEEIEGDVPIAKLNYQGSQTPYVVSPFISGSFSLLQPVIRRIPEGTGDWHLVITQRQDFETPGMQQYMFNVRVDDEPMVVTVSMQIVNIDDNAPIIQMLEPCEIPELGEPGLTECVYVVSDADGEISTRFMRFTVESDREQDLSIFYLEPRHEPQQWYWMYMVVGLHRPLDFEATALHIFRATAWDSLPNTHTVSMMVRVENVESRPPRWVQIFAVQQFVEKAAQEFTVKAIDGDTGIDGEIYYRIETAPEDSSFFHIETIEGGRDGAIFSVDPIDRDELEREVFQLTIIAYKTDDDGNPTFETPTLVVIIVEDINDCAPLPFHPVYNIDIMEETAQTLNLLEFGFHDRDLGQNAQYTVHLESVYPEGAERGFYVAPQVGYQRQTFIMGTLDHSLLDFEVPEYQHIVLRAVAIDMDRPDLVGVATIHINLINWNDEEPIFRQAVQTVSFEETEGEGFLVATVEALDRDINDRVEHTLLGNAVNYLRIDQGTGEIFVAVDNAFNYHRENELFIQVRADDTLGDGPYHTATSQLVIQLQDINNTPPTLRLPRGSPQVEENVPAGFLISDELVATDPDTTADLRFEIDWDTSYATKQGRETPAIEYRECVEIETVFPTPNNRGSAIGRVVVREIKEDVTIDYEEFEVLYLYVRVRDLNTVYGDDYDESTFTITIIDMNDNRPLWVEGTLAQRFTVREVAASGTVVGSVLATDIDGPLYNQVRYTIFTRLDTPEDLVEIDFYTGQITVKEHQAIDADTPPRHNLYYTIIASDQCYAENVEDCPPDPTYWNTEGEITIQIIDTNNKVPVPETDQFDAIVYIYENAVTGDEVVQIIGSDLDRDEIYHKISYQINYNVNPRLRDFFAVDLDTGMVHVEYTTDESLDRDGDEPQHRIFLNLIDNFYGEGDGNRNLETTEVLVVLLDVNDNAPELPEPHELSWSISEGLLQGVRISPQIYARDRDEPFTDNSRVGYRLLGLSAINRELGVLEQFTMQQIADLENWRFYGQLETAMDLRGNWGTYAVHVLAYDYGDPSLSSDEVYELEIRPYNFHEPVFVFPLQGTTIRLAKERAVTNGLLATVDGEFLERIHATDEDGLHAGVVTFQVSGNAEAEQYFDVVNEGENSGFLTLKQLFAEDIREFQLTIRATDGGTEPGTLSSERTVSVVFVPTQGEPVFSTNTVTVAFIEQGAGMVEQFQLPLAQDPKNYLCEDSCHEIYYTIIDGNALGHFIVDPTSNAITLASPVDREAHATHVLYVAASNAPHATSALSASTLVVTVNVREADPKPIFEREVYTAGISTIDTINRELLTIQAAHSEGAPLTYTLDLSTMVVDPTLEAVKESAFVLNANTGVLTLNMQPSASMHGMFEFQVVATDPNDQTDRTEVKIYLISSLNRVFFLFVNTLQQIESNIDFIVQTFSTGFSMTCNVDQVVPASDSNGIALDDATEVRAHFIRDNVPVPAEEIELLRSDTVLLRAVQTTLNTELLVLQDFVTGSSPEVNVDDAAVTVYVLVAISVLLALVCVVLLLTFVFRTRALNRRLAALSMTRYGSVDSGLNRAGLAAPGTNKHAVEGSNPIWNETIKAPDFDAISDVSNDSDLIGIEDLPQFRSDYYPPEDSSSLGSVVTRDPDTVASHGNNFGFNATPFTSGKLQYGL